MEICRGTGTIVRPSGRGPGHSHLASPTVTMQSGYPYELPSSPKNAPKSYDGGGSSNNTPTKSAVVSPRAMPLVSTISRPHMLHHRPTQVMIDSTFTRHQFWNPTNPMANDDAAIRQAQVVLDESLALEEDLDFEDAVELLENHLTPLYESSTVKPIFVYNMAPLYRQLANLLESQGQFDQAIRILRLLVEASTFRHKEFLKEIEIIRRKAERSGLGRRIAVEGQKTIDEIEAEISETELETVCHTRDLGLLFARAGQLEQGKLFVSKACSMLAEMHFKEMDSKQSKKKKKNKDNIGQNAEESLEKKIGLLLAAFCPDMGLICESIGNEVATSPEAQHAHFTTLFRNSASLGLISPSHPHFASLLLHQRYDSEESTCAVKRDLRRLESIIKRYRSILGNKSLELVGLLLGAAMYKRILREFDASFALLEDAGTIVSEALGDKSTYYATILLHKAIHCYTTSDFEKAEHFASTALSIKSQRLGDSHIHVAMIQYDLALILECKGQTEQAKTAIESCIKTLSTHVDEDHPNLCAALELRQRLDTHNNPRNDNGI